MSVIDEVRREREDQVAKGFTAEHDDQHWDCKLVEVAVDVLMSRNDEWSIRRKHVGDRRQQLVIVSALLVAEIERMDREEKAATAKGWKNG
jgi:hypothetical protein